MTQSEYEHYRQRLDEQLGAGIELLKAAHSQQIHALELVWRMGRGEEPGIPAAPSDTPAPVAPPPPPAPSARRLSSRNLVGEIEELLPSLPEVFNRNDVQKALGAEVERSSLFRALRQLTWEGTLVQQSIGGGRIPTTYRRANP